MSAPRRRGRAVYICGGEEQAPAWSVPLDHRHDACANSDNHYPQPASMLGSMALGDLRVEARQRFTRCPDCGLWLIATGGRDVPGWPRRRADVQVPA